MLSYCKILPENPEVEEECPPNWPTKGEVEFDHVTLAHYKHEDAPVLSDVTLKFAGGEKIAVMGPTGSGKTSLALALFRLCSLLPPGHLKVDGVPIDRPHLQSMRSRLSIVPHHPFLFQGTLRANLDPLGMFPDDALWQALECVEMKTVVGNLERKLESLVAENGANFSTGECQLLSLARAVLQRNKIVILDDCLSSTDPHTFNIVDVVLRKYLSDSTVITITHRLDCIINSDRVLMLEKGKVAAFDTPLNLLFTPSSPLFQLARKWGRKTPASLQGRALASAQLKGLDISAFVNQEPRVTPKKQRKERKEKKAQGSGEVSQRPKPSKTRRSSGDN